MRYKLVSIKWVDAVANANWFTVVEALNWAKISLNVVDEVGYLIQENSEYLLLSSSVLPENELCAEMIGQIHVIPIKSIIKIKSLKT